MFTRCLDSYNFYTIITLESYMTANLKTSRLTSYSNTVLANSLQQLD